MERLISSDGRPQTGQAKSADAPDPRTRAVAMLEAGSTYSTTIEATGLPLDAIIEAWESRKPRSTLGKIEVAWVKLQKRMTVLFQRS
jgi:hypothetical protein